MIDLEAATERGIPVCNVPDYCIDEVSTHTIAFVLALNRHLFPPPRMSPRAIGAARPGARRRA